MPFFRRDEFDMFVSEQNTSSAGMIFRSVENDGRIIVLCISGRFSVDVAVRELAVCGSVISRTAENLFGVYAFRVEVN